ncbi:MAG: Amidophosphoribosyltransferase, partial [uncultured Gemmatimonadetes bacterium]
VWNRSGLRHVRGRQARLSRHVRASAPRPGSRRDHRVRPQDRRRPPPPRPGAGLRGVQRGGAGGPSGRRGAGAHPLLHGGGRGAQELAAHPRGLPRGAARAGAQRQPHQRQRAALPAGERGRALPEQHRQRDHRSPHSPLPARRGGGADRRRAVAAHGRVLRAHHRERHAVRRARPFRLPPARDRPPPRRGRRGGVGELRAGHHGRPLRARRGAGRGAAHPGHRDDLAAPPAPRGRAAAVHLRAGLLRPAGHAPVGLLGGPRPPRLRPPPGRRAPGRRGHRDLRAGFGQLGRAGLRGAERHPLRAGPDPQPLRRPHLHRAVAGGARLQGADEVQRRPRDPGGEARGGGGRLPGARHHEPRAGEHAARGGGEGGALPPRLPPRAAPVLLRHRHAHPGGADRRQPHPGRDRRLPGRGLPRLPFAGGDAGRGERRRQLLHCLLQRRLPRPAGGPGARVRDELALL